MAILKQALSDAQTRIEELETQLNAQTAAHAELTTQFQNQAVVIEALQGTKAELVAELETVSTERDGLKAEVTKIEAERDAATKKISEHEREREIAARAHVKLPTPKPQSGDGMPSATDGLKGRAKLTAAIEAELQGK